MESQERRSILCPNCRKLISIDESPCPYCGLRYPGSRWRNIFSAKGFLKGDQLMKYIITLNAAMFILSVVISPTSTGFSMNPFGFLSPGNSSLLLLGQPEEFPLTNFIVGGRCSPQITCTEAFFTSFST